MLVECFVLSVVDVVFVMNIVVFNVGIVFGLYFGGVIIDLIGLIYIVWIGGLMVVGVVILIGWSCLMEKWD